MTKYVALLRGITPSNPSMRNEKLREVFKDMGFGNVQTVISSGNVLFETQTQNSKALETIIEEALLEKLDLRITTIIFSREELELVINKKPFEDIDATFKSKFNVTFLKNKPKVEFEFPYQSENKGFIVSSIYDRAIFSIVNLRRGKTPDLMRWLEKEFGKNITTRTLKTVERIIKRLNES